MSEPNFNIPDLPGWIVPFITLAGGAIGWIAKRKKDYAEFEKTIAETQRIDAETVNQKLEAANRLVQMAIGQSERAEKMSAHATARAESLDLKLADVQKKLNKFEDRVECFKDIAPAMIQVLETISSEPHMDCIHRPKIDPELAVKVRGLLDDN